MDLISAAKQLEITPAVLRQRLDFHELYMNIDNIPDEVVKEWIEEKKQYMEIYDLFELLMEKNFDGKKKLGAAFKKKLKAYARGFMFWGAEVKTATIWGKHPRYEYVNIEHLDLISNGIYEAMLFYVSSVEEIVDFLINEIRKKNINNTEKISDYMVEYKKVVGNLKHYGEVLNYLRFNLDFDFIIADNKKISTFMSEAEKDISKPGMKVLLGFYDYLKEKSYVISDVIITYHKHQNTKNSNVMPYDINTYFQVAYMVFNEKYWFEQDLIKKSIENPMYAKVWLYHAVLFICAWRSNDIRLKLPRLKLKDSPEETLRKIKSFEYSEQEFTVVAEQLFYGFKYQGKRKKPEKIKKNPSAQTLRFTIAESIKPILGMLALMCEAHNQINGEKGALCEMRPVEFDVCQRFFGKAYITILDGKAFSARRANKNYMNLVNEKSEGIDGYMLAAYARSHTGGINHLPEVTARYLTAKMDGYTPDEVVKCMFERGICSFVPYLLCSALYRKDFELIQIPKQTERMKDLSLSPAGIELLLITDALVEKRIKEQIKKIMEWSDSNSIEDLAKDIIENIINGNILGKEEDVFCLAKACYRRCEYPQRESCMGCGNEMYSKSMMIGLGQEIYRQECFLESAITHAEKIKRTAILENKLYPAAHEMLLVMSKIYGMDIKEYKQILIRD